MKIKENVGETNLYVCVCVSLCVRVVVREGGGEVVVTENLR